MRISRRIPLIGSTRRIEQIAGSLRSHAFRMALLVMTWFCVSPNVVPPEVGTPLPRQRAFIGSVFGTDRRRWERVTSGCVARSTERYRKRESGFTCFLVLTVH